MLGRFVQKQNRIVLSGKGKQPRHPQGERRHVHRTPFALTERVEFVPFGV